MNSPVSHNKTEATYHLLNSKARNYFWLRCLAICVFVLNIVFHFVLMRLGIWNRFSLLSLLLFVVLIPFWKKNAAYRSQIGHSESIKKAVNKMSNSAQYHPDHFVPESDFIQSHLYTNVAFRYGGNHLFQDEHTKMSISNISIFHDISGDQVSIFDGVFAKIYLESSTKNSFIMKPAYPYKDQYIPRVFKKLFQRYIPDNYFNITTSNQEFNDSFNIYSPSEDGKLSPQLMLQLLGLKDKLAEMMQQEKETGKYAVFTSQSLLNNSHLEVSVNGHYLFFAIRNMKLFDPVFIENTKESTKKSFQVIQFISQMGLLN